MFYACTQNQTEDVIYTKKKKKQQLVFNAKGNWLHGCISFHIKMYL